MSSNVLEVTAATYLGMGVTDVANAVEVMADCSVLVAGRFSQTDFGVTPLSLATGATTGALVKLDADGKVVRAVSRWGTLITGMSQRPGQGDIALAGDAGLVVVAPDLKTVRWQKGMLGAAQRVAMAADGSVAALFGKTLHVFDATGQERFNFPFGDSSVSDVAIDSASNRVMVTGFAQRDSGGCSKLQVAWIRSYTLSGTPAWKDWDWSHAQAAADGNCADTRGLRLAMGRDGKLYFAGESAGGNTIFRWLPGDLKAAAPNVARDAYTNAYNTASNQITYFARLDPATGAVLKGQLLLARLPNTKGNTIQPNAITADEAGNVYVAGVAGYAIANRQTISINGRTLADYAGRDPWVLAVSSDFSVRRLWVTPADGGTGESLGVAAAQGTVALVGRVNGGPLVTASPVQSTIPGGSKSTTGHLMVWQGLKQ